MTYSCIRRLKEQLPPKRAHLIFWPLVIAGAALDLWSKSAVFAWLQRQPGQEVSLIDGILTLVMRLNDGAAFSMFSGQRWPLVAVSFAALVMILGIFLFGGVRHVLTEIALGLFTAGILGNLYDRLFNEGLVRDFIDVVYWPGKHWPAFNVADSLLCTAVGLLLIGSFFTSEASRTPAPPQKSEHPDPTPGQ